MIRPVSYTYDYHIIWNRNSRQFDLYQEVPGSPVWHYTRSSDCVTPLVSFCGPCKVTLHQSEE